jgi:hypothetical protein
LETRQKEARSYFDFRQAHVFAVVPFPEDLASSSAITKRTNVLEKVYVEVALNAFYYDMKLEMCFCFAIINNVRKWDNFT